MRRALSISGILCGMIEDIDICNLETSPAYYPSIHSRINDLSRSILEKGLLHPLVVRQEKTDGQYQIIAGNRRYADLWAW